MDIYHSRVFRELRQRLFGDPVPPMDWMAHRSWRERAKTQKVAYFVADTFPRFLTKLSEMPGNMVRAPIHFLINYRSCTHGMLSRSLKRGSWHEFDERMLYSMFDSFQSFVEIECANNHVMWSQNLDVKKKYGITWYNYNRLVNVFYSKRMPAAGVDRIKWEMSFTDDDNKGGSSTRLSAQSLSAHEQMELYVWWTVIRPNRLAIGASVLSGSGPYFDELLEKYKGQLSDVRGIGINKLSKITTPAETTKLKQLQNAQTELLAQWDEDDDIMLQRLVKIRRSLWS